MKSDPLVKINELIEQDYLIVVDTNVLLGLYVSVIKSSPQLKYPRKFD